MKAAVWYARGDVRVEEVPPPNPPGPLDVQVRVHCCGICGSDVREYRDGPILIPTTRPNALTGRVAPLIIGHELAGEIVALGSDVSGLRLGERVTAVPARYCLACAACRAGRFNNCVKAASLGFADDGAMTEYVNVPARGVYRLPPNVSLEQGALVEPLAVAVHALRQVSLQPHQALVIVGAGPMGISALMAARAVGCSATYVVARDAGRQRLAIQLGATKVVDPASGDAVTAIRDLTGGEGADVVLECGGTAESVALAISMARRGATVGMVGLFSAPQPVDVRRLVTRELRVVGCLAYADEWPDTIDLIASGKLDASALIAKRITLSQVVEEGLHPLAERRIAGVKVMVEMSAR